MIYAGRPSKWGVLYGGGEYIVEKINEAVGFTTDEIMEMQEIVRSRIGGGAGVLDMGILESSAKAPFDGFGDLDLYPGIMEKAARYATAFDKKQVFVDGNKRVSVSVMLGWLARNGYRCTLTNFALHEMMMDLANNKIQDEEDLANILRAHTEHTDQYIGMNIGELMNALLDTYEMTYIMLGKGAGDPSIDEWKASMRASGDAGDYRK